MRVVSIQVGKGCWIEKNGKRMFSAIGKSPLAGPARTNGASLLGDEQADRKHHGGFYQAIYGFAAEEYSHWQDVLLRELPAGAFGENLTVEGLDERDLKVGDRFKLGSAELAVRGPRIPCATLEFWMERPGFIELYVERARPGVYFSIERQGEFDVQESLTLSVKSESNLSVQDVFLMLTGRIQDKSLLVAAAGVEALPPGFREKFRRLAN